MPLAVDSSLLHDLKWECAFWIRSIIKNTGSGVLEEGSRALFEYIGNIHIHSRFSDGERSIERIAREANREKLDFIIITDHRTLKGRKAEGYHQRVLVLAGMEANRDKNHYLALDVNRVVEDNDEHPQMVIDQVNQQKGIGIIAHPVEKGSPCIMEGRTYPWTDWGVKGFQGIEIWNFLSRWRDGVQGLCSALYLLLYPAAGVGRPYPEVMTIWDELLKKDQPVMAYCGSDAHGSSLKIGPLRIPVLSYARSFRLLNVHILSPDPLRGDATQDASVVYDCLRRGRFWMACDYPVKSRGFCCQVESGEQIYMMGSRIPWQPGTRLKVTTPRQASVQLIHNGQIYSQSTGREHLFPLSAKGVYRLEVLRLPGKRPWIYTNPWWIT